MSRIQSIAPYFNYRQQKNSKTSNSSDFTSKTSFGANPGEELADAVKAYGDKNLPPTIGRMGRVFVKLQKNDGEVQNQLVNALFTSTLAPVVIAYNPVSNTEEKTKQYSALRQPVSALTAIAFGLLATMPANMFVENILSEGHLESIDLRVKPDEKYLKRLYKKEYSAADKAGTLEQFKKENTPKGWSGAFDENAFVKARQDKAEAAFTRLLLEKPEKLIADKELNKQIKNLKSYVDKHNLNNLDAKTVMHEKFKVALNKEGKLKVHAFKKKLHDIKAMDFLREFGLIKSDFNHKTGSYAEGSFTEEQLKEFILSFRQKKVEESARKNFKVNSKQAKDYVTEEAKLIARQIQFSTNHREETVTMVQMLETMEIKDEFIADIKSGKMVEALNNFKNKYLKDMVVSPKGAAPVKLSQKSIDDFAKQLVKNIIKKTESDAKNMKKYTGLVVALCTLPFSCGLLNWLYPRVVEKIAPSLVPAKGGK